MNTIVATPTKKVGGLFVKVLTFDLESENPDVPETEMIKNFTHNDGRDWLMKHLFWAFNNHRAVEIVALTDDAK